MIQFLNNILNKILILIKYICLICVSIIWLLTYPFYRVYYEIKSINSKSAFVSHPNLVLLSWVMKISKFFDRFIF